MGINQWLAVPWTTMTMNLKLSTNLSCHPRTMRWWMQQQRPRGCQEGPTQLLCVMQLHVSQTKRRRINQKRRHIPPLVCTPHPNTTPNQRHKHLQFCRHTV
eukprot:4566288-Amphidinium_carterae.1